MTSRYRGFIFNPPMRPSGVLPSPPVGVRKSPYFGNEKDLAYIYIYKDKQYIYIIYNDDDFCLIILVCK